MPRLYHRKSTLGCTRCKKRRVKCDEKRPKCGACERHQVECEYAPTRRSSEPLTPQLQLAQASQDGMPAAELRLLHNFLLNTSHSFNNISDYWRFRASIASYTFRPFFDGILALSALHLYRQAQFAQITQAPESQYDFRIFLAGSTPQEMHRRSIYYLHRAIQGVRESLSDDKKRDYESLIVGSSLITINAMFLLAEHERGDENVPQFNEDLWLRLGVGPRELSFQWLANTNENQAGLLEVASTKPDVNDIAELFNPECAAPFSAILDWGSDYEYLDEVDRDAYLKTISYLGVTYKAMRDRTETPLATARRFNVFPSRVPARFVEMALEKKPRAMVVLAHAFALMKILARDVYWFDGIAEKQVPLIYERLPQAWRAPMQWPFAVLDMAPEPEASLPEPPSLDSLLDSSKSDVVTVVMPFASTVHLQDGLNYTACPTPQDQIQALSHDAVFSYDEIDTAVEVAELHLDPNATLLPDTTAMINGSSSDNEWDMVQFDELLDGDQLCDVRIIDELSGWLSSRHDSAIEMSDETSKQTSEMGDPVQPRTLEV